MTIDPLRWFLGVLAAAFISACIKVARKIKRGELDA